MRNLSDNYPIRRCPLEQQQTEDLNRAQDSATAASQSQYKQQQQLYEQQQQRYQAQKQAYDALAARYLVTRDRYAAEHADISGANGLHAIKNSLLLRAMR